MRIFYIYFIFLNQFKQSLINLYIIYFFHFLKFTSIYLVDLQIPSSKINLVLKICSSITVLTSSTEFICSRPNDSEDCGINGNQRGQYLANIVDGHPFPMKHFRLLESHFCGMWPSIILMEEHHSS